MQSSLPFMPSDKEHLDVPTLETWLWDAACAIRGTTDAPKFKDFILPLIFYKRLSDVFDDEFAEYVEAYGAETIAHEIIKADHTDALKSGRKPIVRFYVPGEYRWQVIRNHVLAFYDLSRYHLVHSMSPARVHVSGRRSQATALR
jgi:type I restriction enzyme M protein